MRPPDHEVRPSGSFARLDCILNGTSVLSNGFFPLRGESASVNSVSRRRRPSAHGQKEAERIEAYLEAYSEASEAEKCIQSQHGSLVPTEAAPSVP